MNENTRDDFLIRESQLIDQIMHARAQLESANRRGDERGAYIWTKWLEEDEFLLHCHRTTRTTQIRLPELHA